MLKKILLLITLLILIIPTSTLHASDEVGIIASNWFTKFSLNISKKYSDTNEIKYFELFNIKLNQLLLKKSFTTTQITLINDIIKLANERVFNLSKYNNELETKNILKSNKLISDFKYISYNPENIFIENWIWYYYKFDSHLIFPSDITISTADLAYNWIYSNSSLVFLRADNQLGFTNTFSKVKIISDSIIYWVAWKINFLKEVKDDKKVLIRETDYAFKSLKINTLNLTNWKSDSDKIKIIYDYVLKNVEYTKDFSLKDYKIYSGINTYVDKNWVCEWYTKLFLYMLNFAWINHSEVIRWYVLDANDFPEVWHAWIRIWDKFYDPTFDDPSWQINTRKYSDYLYYWLPYDLFHVNRYDLDKMPTFLKQKSVEFRETFIARKTKPLVYKYRDSGFNILKPYILRLNNWIEIEQKIEIEQLKKITEYYEVRNWNFIKIWVSKNIKTLQFFKVTDATAEGLVRQLDYNLEWYYLLKWYFENWNYEYRLWYDITYNN